MGFSAPGRKSSPALTSSRRRTQEPHKEAHLRRISRFKLHDILLSTCRFDPKFSVANGALSQVYGARLSDGTPIFVKRAWPGDRYWEGQVCLENERLILSACRSKYLLNLVGVSDDTPEKVLILEHASHGSLFDALHKNSLGPIEWPARIQLAHHIALAIRGLHGARTPCAHRDVRSSNVWISDNWSAKLGGFGFASRSRDRSAPVVPAKCPHKAMAAMDPDYQAAGHLCTKTDIFCFGVLLLEIISGRKPVDVNHRPSFVVDWALPLIHHNKVNLLCDPNMRPPFRNSKVVLDMARIAERCLTTVSFRRPTMAEVSEDLRMLTLKVPLCAQEARKTVLEWYSTPSLHTVRPDGAHGALSTAEEAPQASVKAANIAIAKQDLVSTFRCGRPSMLFGRIAPQQFISPQSYLGMLEDAVAKKQRGPYLPPHLRHITS